MVLGLGTWRLNGPKCTEIVKEALEMGCRHWHCWYIWPAGYGPACRASGIDRNELFITSKVNRLDSLWWFLKKTDKILNELKLNTWFLIHWPKDIPIEETLKAIAELKVRGKVKNLGVSILRNPSGKIADLYRGYQCKSGWVHPYLYQSLAVIVRKWYCLTAYSPWEGWFWRQDKELAEEYEHVPCQLFWSGWWRRVVVIPKAVRGSLKDNLEVLNMDIPATSE